MESDRQNLVTWVNITATTTTTPTTTTTIKELSMFSKSMTYSICPPLSAQHPASLKPRAANPCLVGLGIYGRSCGENLKQILYMDHRVSEFYIKCGNSRSAETSRVGLRGVQLYSFWECGVSLSSKCQERAKWVCSVFSTLLAWSTEGDQIVKWLPIIMIKEV